MDVANLAESSGVPGGVQPTRQIADLSSAIEIMRQLNPQCDNDQLLYRMLTAHINGESITLTPEEIVAAGGRQILVPLPTPETERAVKEVGFKVKHSFKITQPGAPERECVCVKVVESPEVLAVHDLFDSPELGYIRSSIEDLQYEPALSTTMKVRIEDEQDTHEFVVPNDADDTCLSSPTMYLQQRNCEVAFINRRSHLYKIIAARLRAVHPRECTGTIQDIALERYLPNHSYEQGHFSHQRFGAVMVPLETLEDGGLSLTSIGLQLTPLAGMGIWLPSRFDAPVPDLRTDFAIHNPNSVPLHYIVAWINAKTDHKEVVQGDSRESSSNSTEDEARTSKRDEASVSPDVVEEEDFDQCSSNEL